jgi:hypothetical protein
MGLARIAIVAIVALAPAISQAASERASFEACVSAFEKSIATPGAETPQFKVAYRGDRFTGTVAQIFQTQFSYDLEASSPKAGVVARARCATDRRGVVSSLVPLPLDARAPASAGEL